jgi:periplasmic protein TonB
VVEKDGQITNIEIKRGVDSDLDKEAKRLIRKMPKWIAGETHGKKVRTHVVLPINFVLRN